MISCTHFKSAKVAAGYLTKEQNGTQPDKARGEYYADDQVRSAWGGEGAALAGYELDGSVSAADLHKVLSGQFREPANNNTERQLGRIDAEGKTDHRAGMDFTFSAPKSISIAAEIYDSTGIRAAHEAAVNAAMDYLESTCAQTRANGQMVQTQNLVYAKFEHSLTRELDPSTHTHVAIANVTYHNGKAYSLSNEELLNNRATADQIYKNELAAELQMRGYQIEFDKYGNPELMGITAEQRAEFSNRSQQIDDYLKAKGIDPDRATNKQREVACLATRAAKSAPESAAQQRTQWLERAANINLKEPLPRISQAQAYTLNAGKEAVASSIAHLAEREAAFSQKEIYANAAKFSEGRATYSQIRAAMIKAERSGELIRRDDGKLTTLAATASEQALAARLEAGKDAHQAVMTPQAFDKALANFERDKGFALTEEQRAAASMILTGKDAHAGVQGLAGTGKTTMLEFVRVAAESQGWTVTGFSNGANQAQKMQQESGIQTTTTASYLLSQDKAQRDQQRAAAALKTFEAGIKPNLAKLEEQVSNGEAVKEYDSAGNAYIIDKASNTHALALHATSNSTTSRNINHLGLTQSKYQIVNSKGLAGIVGMTTVIKTGGSLKNEAAGALKDSIKSHHIAARLTRTIISKAEGWKSAGTLESAAARIKIAVENRTAHVNALADLKQQAEIKPSRELRIMDEASMSGQKEFANVAQAADGAGAKQIYLGDKLQHQSVEAGTAFEQAQKYMPVSNLEQISRQKTDHAKATVKHILDNKHAVAIRSLPTHQVQSEQTKVKAQYQQKIEHIEAKKSVGEKLNDRDKSTLRMYKDDLKQAAQKDNVTVIKNLAKDYAALSPKERAETIIVTATNADRASINTEIRDQLKAKGEIKDSRTMQVLERKDMTAEQAKRAVNYQQGDIVKFGNAYKNLGLERGELVTVLKTDTRTNTITAMTNRGSTVTYQPDRHQAQAYQAKERELGIGDKIKFAENNRDFDVKNGQSATIERIESASLRVRLEDGKTKTIDMSKYKHIDHAYASTSQAAQGQTVNRTMIHHNTEAGKHGQRETYVNATRARMDTKLYTQDKAKAAEQAGVRIDKTFAISATVPVPQPTPETKQPEPDKTRSRDNDYSL
ncbi:MobF family relaxase [Sulfuriferula thiophila]|uniref:MobF family relaxase n=1 Tax=Sulfuriferula thiophila TaxID=1781211 RepID=UPI000F60FB56|nr:MobF family relaxase [Sulfuriferula thiophila]